MHAILPNRGLRLRNYLFPQQRQVLPEGLEIGRDEGKDCVIEKANHVAEFHVSEINKVR